MNLLGPLNTRRDEVVCARTPLWCSEKIICSLHVNGGQNCRYSPDDAFYVLRPFGAILSWRMEGKYVGFYYCRYSYLWAIAFFRTRSRLRGREADQCYWLSEGPGKPSLGLFFGLCGSVFGVDLLLHM